MREHSRVRHRCAAASTTFHVAAKSAATMVVLAVNVIGYGAAKRYEARAWHDSWKETARRIIFDDARQEDARF
jgi:hypothetical protein